MAEAFTALVLLALVFGIIAGGYFLMVMVAEIFFDDYDV